MILSGISSTQTHLHFVAVVGDDDDVPAFIQSRIQRLTGGVLSRWPDVAVLQQDDLVHAGDHTCGLYKTLTDI